MKSIPSHNRGVVFGLLATIGASIGTMGFRSLDAGDPPTLSAIADREATPFDKALKLILENEGGVNSHPADRQNVNGSVTFKGITQAQYKLFLEKPEHPERSSYPRTTLGLSQMEDAAKQNHIVSKFYEEGYWRANKCEELAKINLGIAVFHFDSCVLFNAANMTAVLQEAVGAEPDCIIGPKTLEKVAQQNPRELIIKLAQTRRTLHRDAVWRNPSQEVFLDGWLGRVDDVEAAALDLAGKAKPVSAAVAPAPAPAPEVTPKTAEFSLKAQIVKDLFILSQVIGEGEILKHGSRGPVVGSLQRLLNEAMPDLPPIEVDNDYGNLTGARVAMAQGRVGISQDRKVGPKTERAIMRLLHDLDLIKLK